MQLRIDQSGLARELGLVTLAARSRLGRQSDSLVRLEARADGALRLVANSLEYGLASEVEARVLEAGAICLPAKPFLALVQALDGEITISTDANQYAIITAERSRSRMPG